MDTYKYGQQKSISVNGYTEGHGESMRYNVINNY
jgi:hypothetical protein